MFLLAACNLEADVQDPPGLLGLGEVADPFVATIRLECNPKWLSQRAKYVVRTQVLSGSPDTFRMGVTQGQSCCTLSPRVSSSGI